MPQKMKKLERKKSFAAMILDSYFRKVYNSEYKGLSKPCPLQATKV